MEQRAIEGRPHRAAFIDLGTNSIRILIAEIDPGRTYSILRQEKEVARLGEGLFGDGLLEPEAIDRAVQIAKTFRQLADAHGAEEIVCVGTSATREAENRDELILRLHDEAGLDVRIVSGREEARLIYLGVSSGLNIGKQNALFIDIGGGSTELMLGDQNQHYYLDSLKLGSVRLTNLFFPVDFSDRVSPKKYGRLQEYARNATIRAVQRLEPFSIDLTIGSSGTITNMCEIAQAMLYKKKREGLLKASLADIQTVAARLCGMTLAERRNAPGINPERADIIVAGAAIIQTVMEELKLKSIQVSERGLQHGLLLDYLTRAGDRGSIRLWSVLQFARACRFDEAHAERVAALALEMFESAREVGLHSLGEQEAELLRYAALLHDVGGFLSYSNHQAHSYYFIINADLLGFDQTEIAIMASAAFYHRKSLPKRKHPEFGPLDAKSQSAVRVLAIFLRLAESLDRGHANRVQSARFVKSGPRAAKLQLSADADSALELWGLEAQGKAFLKTFDRQLEFELAPSLERLSPAPS